MSYQQLTEGKRYQIAALIAQGLRPIARIINVHRSTVYRELRRNRRERQYDPAQAHALTQQRRRCSAKYRAPQDTIDFVELTLSWEWSPEQISGVSHQVKYMNESKYVQYGCRWSAPSRWQNFDASPTLRFERTPLIGRPYTKNQSRFPSNAEYGAS